MKIHPQKGINNMSMNTKPTTGKKLQDVIRKKLVTVVGVQIDNKDTNKIRAVTPEQFVTDLDFYMESGIFADSLDFKYGITGKDMLQVNIGYMSCYCSNCIEVKLKLNEGTLMDDANAQLRVVICEDLSA